jgi:tripartite-type tricarboxylate transporter receptor subunit TctC
MDKCIAARIARVMAVGCLPCTLAAVVDTAQAQPSAYPSRPLRIIVTSEAGSAPDVLARVLGQLLNGAFGQPVVVENRPGAGGVIGYELASRAQPDGYTLVMATVAFVTTSTIHEKLSYDPATSFTPIARVASSPYVLVVSSQFPAKTLKELIELARTEKTNLNYGSPGNGTAQHLTTELVKKRTGVDMVHVPYKSGAGAVNAVLSGEVQLFFAGLPPALPHVKTGRLRALAVTSPQRFSALMGVPTLAEGGLPNLEVDQWHAIIAPGGMRKPLVERLNAEIVRSVQSPEVRQLLLSSGAEANPSTPEELRKLLHSEVAKWNEAARAAGLRSAR